MLSKCELILLKCQINTNNEQARNTGTVKKRIDNSGEWTDGTDGTDGTDVIDGTDGIDGIDGIDGTDRIRGLVGIWRTDKGP